MKIKSFFKKEYQQLFKENITKKCWKWHSGKRMLLINRCPVCISGPTFCENNGPWIASKRKI